MTSPTRISSGLASAFSKTFLGCTGCAMAGRANTAVQFRSEQYMTLYGVEPTSRVIIMITSQRLLAEKNINHLVK
jgi:hypothetical protein